MPQPHYVGTYIIAFIQIELSMCRKSTYVFFLWSIWGYVDVYVLSSLFAQFFVYFNY